MRVVKDVIVEFCVLVIMIIVCCYVFFLLRRIVIFLEFKLKYSFLLSFFLDLVFY